MNLPRIDLIPEHFEQLIDHRGYNLLHYRSMLCPCINEETGAPDPNCALCDHGYQYWGEEEIKGIITGITNEKQFTETGGFLLGSMQLTVPASIRIGYHDRIIHVDSTIPYGELLTRAEITEEPLRYTPVEVERVVDLTNEYTRGEGEDYTVIGKRIVWNAEKGPAVGVRYAVVYQCHPVWGVLSYLHLVRDTTVKTRHPVEQIVKLPLQVLCKLEFLMEP